LLNYTFNANSVSKDVSRIYEDVINKHVETQKAYDVETNHSIDSAQQRVWDNKITRLLKDNEEFADYK
jgi:predicted secreted Zn-dependent protease